MNNLLMDQIVYIKGFSVGFFLCAPIGPIGTLCVRRALFSGLIAGFVSVLGASLADVVYCSIAGFGLSWISDFLLKEKFYIQFIGALILVVLAICIFLSHPSQKDPKAVAHGLFGSFSSTFVMTLMNPMSILIYSATFAALGVYGWRVDYIATAALVGGIFTGSVLWAPILILIVGLFRPQLNPRQLRIMHIMSGTVILGFGVVLGLMSFIR